MNEDFEAKTRKAINELQRFQQQQQNRLLACEALMVAMLHRTAPQALAGLAEE